METRSALRWTVKLGRGCGTPEEAAIVWTFKVEAETAAARVVSVAGEEAGETSIGDAALVSGLVGASCGFGVEIG